MKYIRLLVEPDTRFEPGTPEAVANLVDYRQLVMAALRSPLDRQAGATIDEMRKSIRVMDALDAASGDVLALEDADWETLKEKVNKMPWAMVDRRILTFCDAVLKPSDKPLEPEATESPSGAPPDGLDASEAASSRSNGQAVSVGSGEASS
jgi:hypothetical protein